MSALLRDCEQSIIVPPKLLTMNSVLTRQHHKQQSCKSGCRIKSRILKETSSQSYYATLAKWKRSKDCHMGPCACHDHEQVSFKCPQILDQPLNELLVFLRPASFAIELPRCCFCRALWQPLPRHYIAKWLVGGVEHRI